jgi:hypothetical protein
MSTINNVDDNFMLAGGRTTVGSRGGVAPLWAGAAQTVADSAPALAAFSLYELAHLKLDGSGVEKFVAGTSEASRAVIVSQPTLQGQQCVYWNEGYFNHEAIKFPAGVALDSYTKRKAMFTGTPIRFGHTI